VGIIKPKRNIKQLKAELYLKSIQDGLLRHRFPELENLFSYIKEIADESETVGMKAILSEAL